MGKLFERRLRKIDSKIQTAALIEINKARAVFGGKPLNQIPVKGANNHIGGCSTPLGLAMSDLMTPEYDDGSGFLEIDALYTGVWEISNEDTAMQLATAWNTKSEILSPLRYCCHRHFAGEQHLIVHLPQSLKDYESAVCTADDYANDYANATAILASLAEQDELGGDGRL